MFRYYFVLIDASGSHSEVSFLTIQRFHFKLRPTLLNQQTPYEFLSGRPPNISHLRVFGCQVWVPISEPKKQKLGPHRQEGIYVGFDSASIIRYIDPSNGALLKARFANCRFIETSFPALPNPPNQPPLNFSAPETLTMNPDPPTSLHHTEVTKLLHLKSLAENIPDGFSSKPRIIRNPLPGTRNTLPRQQSEPKPSKRPRVHLTTDIRRQDEVEDDHLGRPEDMKTRRPSEHISGTIQAWGTQLPNLSTLNLSNPSPSDTTTPYPDLSQSLHSNPSTLNQAMSRPNWPEWKAAINT